MSKILEYNGFRAMATWLANSIKSLWDDAAAKYIKDTAFIWVETANNITAINTELKVSQDESREPQEITLPDLVDGEHMSLVPSSRVTYMYI